jgi:acetyl esterase/lipase
MLAIIARWLLTLAALALAAIACVLAYAMLDPVDFPATYALAGSAALIFPLHLLMVTAVAAILALAATRLRGWLATGLFGAVAAVTACLALWPGIAMWQFARQNNVPLSLGDYLADAASINTGAPQPERSVEYGIAGDGTRLLLDLWLADDAGPPRSAVVIVHGGGWAAGTRSMLPRWNRWLNTLGYHVFDVEYRLTSAERWKDQVGDVKCALGFLALNAAKYRIDPARISIWGNSAGGHLAMLAANTMGKPELPPSCAAPVLPVRSVVNLYGPVDLALGYDTSPSIDYARKSLTAFIGGTPRQVPERYRLLSPLNHVSPKSPPTITFLGISDRIIREDQAILLDQALEGAGVARETHLLPANDHGFDINWGGFGTQFARARIERFLRQQDNR